jgi:hypothetical protein
MAVPVSLAQLVGQLHYICRGPEFEPRSSHLSILRVEYLAIRLLNQKKEQLYGLQAGADLNIDY